MLYSSTPWVKELALTILGFAVFIGVLTYIAKDTPSIGIYIERDYYQETWEDTHDSIHGR